MEFRRDAGAGQCLAKIFAVRSVPADDRVESSEIFPKANGNFEIANAGHIETSRRDGTNKAGESDQGNDRGRNPDLRVVRFEMFEGRKRENAIADRARANQQPIQSLPAA